MFTRHLLLLLASLGAISSVIADTSCSATVPCAIGCCGEYGVCGMGPNYCGADVCINSCDAKAECNPDNWPSQYVNATTCPLDVCCIQYGFCGTTEEFCGNKTVTAPSCDASSHDITRVIGYYNSAAASRSCDSMAPYSVPEGVYTHIYFAFGSINPDTFEAIPAEESDKDLYPELAALQMRDPDQEIWLSIGGWDFSDSDEPTATTFSDLAAADSTKQAAFFKSLINFMSTYGFTGVDIDWEYPVAGDRNGRAEDYKNYPTFLASLKKALADYKFGLSITLPTSYWYLQHFDLTAIEPSVDWFNVMTYDLHGTWDEIDVWTGPYLDAHTNLTEIKSALDLLWGVNIKPSKVNLGLAFYGRSFTLLSSSCTEPGCEYLSAGNAGQCSDSAGVLFNSEIEDIISEFNLTSTLYKDAAVKTITWDTDQWVSYDDEETWKLKAEYAKSVCLGGVMVWSVDEDDDLNTFSDGLAAALGISTTSTTSPDTSLQQKTSSTKVVESQSDYCRFINCGDVCPNGFSEITREDKKSQLMLDSTECPPGAGQTQTLCCPTSSDLPTCRWRGFHNSGKCKGGRESGEAEVGTITKGCHSGYQSACCTITNSTEPWSECAWTSKCESDDTCPSGYDNFIVGSRQGWGGLKSCSGSKNYNYCCKGSSAPDMVTNCAWYGHQVSFVNTAYCSDACPSGAIRVAEESINILWNSDKSSKADSKNCWLGNEAYCCNGTTRTVTTVSPRSSDPTLSAFAYEFEFYLDLWLSNPTCSPTEDVEYSATFHYTRDLSERAKSSNSAALFDILVTYVVTWITTKTLDEELKNIWDKIRTRYGYEDTMANGTVMRQTLYTYDDYWTGTPIYAPYTMVAQELCNVADSATGLENLSAASSSLCEINPTSSSTTKRMLLEDSMEDRSANDDQPTIYAAIEGVLNNQLIFHYARWLRSVNRNDENADPTQVMLEVAYWIGDKPGTAPSSTLLAQFGDSSHTVQTDRWIIFHFHIALDRNTFYNQGYQQFNFYPGVTALSVYQSQTIHQLGSTNSRAEYVFSSTYAGGNQNTGTMQNYNSRSQALDCDPAWTASQETGATVQGLPTRWYIGRDRADSIAELRSAGRPPAYSTALNEFGLRLFQEGIFSASNMARIWPTVGTRWEGGEWQMNSHTNGDTAYSPTSTAFNSNFDGSGNAVNIAGTAPKTPK